MAGWWRDSELGVCDEGWGSVVRGHVPRAQVDRSRRTLSDIGSCQSLLSTWVSSHLRFASSEQRLAHDLQRWFELRFMRQR